MMNDKIEEALASKIQRFNQDDNIFKKCDEKMIKRQYWNCPTKFKKKLNI